VETGTTVGVFEILAPLGAGGMGEVYRAKDQRLGREVALKVMPEEMASDEALLARFEQEAKVLASLNHPNIAVIYGLEETEDTLLLVLELVEGKTLSEGLDEGPLTVEEALGVGGQIAEAIEAAHEKGVLHRDLKPSNIMVTPKGRVKILDFGIAKALPEQQGNGPFDELTATGVLVGTVPYMSPEQIRGHQLDGRADIWALGCVLYEMLAGKRAFDRETAGDTLAMILEGEPLWGDLPSDTPETVRAREGCRAARFSDRRRAAGPPSRPSIVVGKPRSGHYLTKRTCGVGRLTRESEGGDRQVRLARGLRSVHPGLELAGR
jgi:serine/threonine protein kinase